MSAETRLAEIADFPVPEAKQAVAVDGDHFYAVGDREIAKYTKEGEPVAKAESPPGLIHLDSAVVVDGRIYCAHSNYDLVPMTSSIEIWDAKSLKHVASHSFGILLGSLTWLDRHGGSWWATFANYDRPGRRPDGSSTDVPYGGKRNTTLVELDADWRVVASWIFPEALLARFGEMSNSGGSWGPDGKLYLTGHDAAELYKVRIPKAGSVVELEEIVPAPIRGQGIAWDRSRPGVLYGIRRAGKQEHASGRPNRVVVLEVE